MLTSMESTIHISSPMEFEGLDLSQNYTRFFSQSDLDDVSRVADPDYEQFLADVWVGIVLTLMVLSCVCCMCSCLLYHKFQQWKRSLLEGRHRSSNLESGSGNDTESLPSYTIVSGLPSYDEAIEQLRQVTVQSKNDISDELKNDSSEPWVPHTPPTTVKRLSVSELLQIYKTTSVPSTHQKT